MLAILILPWALPSVVSGVLWRRIFDPDTGLLNSFLVQPHIIDQPHVWLADQGVGDRSSSRSSTSGACCRW